MSFYFKVKDLYYKIFPVSSSFKRDLRYFKNCSAILDIGCGKGFFVTLDKDRITGLDNNKESVDICKSKGLNVIKWNCLDLPFKNNSFDGILCSHLIEHLIPEDVFKLVKEINRVLKKGGIIIIKTPLPSFSFWNDPTHIRPFVPSSIFSIFNVVDLGQPTRKIDCSYEFVDMKFSYHNLYYSYIEPSVNPKRYWFYSIWRGISKFSKIRLPIKESVTIVLRKVR
jgi:SAM-dependent methyltransferase